MKQRVFVNKDTNRVQSFYMASADVVDMQPCPANCFRVDMPAPMPLSNDWIYQDGSFVFSPIVIEKSYRIKRAESYPPVGNQLDAIMKMAMVLKEQNIPLPQETIDWIDSCLAVKDQYPKP
jgi:hypothetical protein